MTEAPSSERLTTCFTQWEAALKQRRELLTATFVAGDEPGLVAALQQRINEYFSCSAAAFAAVTATEGTAALEEGKQNVTLQVPGFEIIEELGTGGMGAVYRVHQTVLEREWAMKFVRPDRMTATAKARFLSEAVAMAKLKHPNIIHVHDYHEPQSAHDVPYLLMPVYPTSLLKQSARIRADRKQAVRVLAGIAAGVGYLHERGYLHRDIKPHNVLLTDTDVPIVSDFGLVKDLAKSDASGDGIASPGETYPVAAGQTQIGSVMGTVRYMAPEQAAGQTQLANPTWDVWSIGVMAHELLTGHAPPSSLAPHQMLNPATPDNPAPSTFCSTLEPELERIVQKCLARETKDRYPSAVALAADLDKWLNPPKSKWPRVLTGIAALVALVTLAVALWPKKPTPEPDPRDELLATLARDGKAEVLGTKGTPKYRRFVAGQEFASEREWVSDKAYSLDTHNVCLLEVLPPDDNRQAIVRIQADIRINGLADSSALAGVYVGQAQYETPNGLENVAAAAYMRPVNAKQPNGIDRVGVHNIGARVMSHKTTATFPKNNAAELLESVTYPNPFRSPDKDGDWHTLTLELHPKKLRYAFDGQARDVTLATFVQEVKHITGILGTPLNAVHPPTAAEGCGLFVSNAHASFRNVKIEYVRD